MGKKTRTIGGRGGEGGARGGDVKKVYVRDRMRNLFCLENIQSRTHRKVISSKLHTFPSDRTIRRMQKGNIQFALQQSNDCGMKKRRRETSRARGVLLFRSGKKRSERESYKRRKKRRTVFNLSYTKKIRIYLKEYL